VSFITIKKEKLETELPELEIAGDSRSNNGACKKA
jgi:hypothetical protein